MRYEQAAVRIDQINVCFHGLLVYLTPIGHCSAQKSQTSCLVQFPLPYHDQSCTTLSEG